MNRRERPAISGSEGRVCAAWCVHFCLPDPGIFMLPVTLLVINANTAGGQLRSHPHTSHRGSSRSAPARQSP